MNTMAFKYIRIGQGTELSMHNGKPVYWIVNIRSNSPIGQIFWYTPWRRWCARFKEESVWSPDCLVDVNKAIKALTEEGGAR